MPVTIPQSKRIDIEDHTMTATITTSAWIDEDEHFVASLVVDAAAGTVFALFLCKGELHLAGLTTGVAEENVSHSLRLDEATAPGGR